MNKKDLNIALNFTSSVLKSIKQDNEKNSKKIKEVRYQLILGQTICYIRMAQNFFVSHMVDDDVVLQENINSIFDSFTANLSEIDDFIHLSLEKDLLAID